METRPLDHAWCMQHYMNRVCYKGGPVATFAHSGSKALSVFQFCLLGQCTMALLDCGMTWIFIDL